MRNGCCNSNKLCNKKNVKKIFGKLAYFFYALNIAFKARSLPLSLKFDGGEINDKFALMLAINSKYVASFRLNKNFAFNDGYVDLVLVQENKKRVTIKSLMAIVKIFLFGISKRMNSRVLKLRLKKFKLTAPDSAVINLDGEGVGSGEIDFEVIKDGIKIIV